MLTETCLSSEASGWTDHATRLSARAPAVSKGVGIFVPCLLGGLRLRWIGIELLKGYRGGRVEAGIVEGIEVRHWGLVECVGRMGKWGVKGDCYERRINGVGLVREQPSSYPWLKYISVT